MHHLLFVVYYLGTDIPVLGHNVPAMYPQTLSPDSYHRDTYPLDRYPRAYPPRQIRPKIFTHKTYIS